MIKKNTLLWARVICDGCNTFGNGAWVRYGDAKHDMAAIFEQTKRAGWQLDDSGQTRCPACLAKQEG